MSKVLIITDYIHKSSQLKKHEEIMQELTSSGGLLIACRAFSSDNCVNNVFNLIPHCLCFGQAAGTAAALAIDSDVTVRNVDHNIL